LISSVGSGVSGNRDGIIAVTATNSGTFTVVASAVYLNQSGTYTLSFVQIPGAFVISPGDEGGTLTNGAATTGTMDVGDLDVWSFPANRGDVITLRLGATNFNPRIDLYAPDGRLIGTAGSPTTGVRDAVLSTNAPTNGMYTVVASAYNLNQSGTYALNLARIPAEFVVTPGDQGGPMVNGFRHNATNTLGDLDLWSFFGTGGDSNFVWLIASNFTADLRFYGPDRLHCYGLSRLPPPTHSRMW
jgi:hypothetical protein